MTESRVPHRRYEDPLDTVWLATAAELGLRVRRSDEAYAATDGAGALVLGSTDTLDADDGLAQMIFHELCHALVQGEASFEQPDWGLDNTSARDVAREHAALRVQAFLADRHGLRGVLAPTTDFRSFWDALPEDPLEPRGAADVAMAVTALQRARRAPWDPALDDALRATASVALQARGFAVRAALRPAATDAAPAGLPSLWLDTREPAGRHQTGHPLARAPGRECGACAWAVPGGGARATLRCRQSEGARVEAAWPACERWEPLLECTTCAACCRAAYDLVMTTRRDPFVKKHPDLAIVNEDHVQVRRDGDRCAALAGGRADGERFTCTIYEDRPRPCRAFELQGKHCLDARRRIGLSL